MAHEIKIMGCLSIPDNTSWEESISLFICGETGYLRNVG